MKIPVKDHNDFYNHHLFVKDYNNKEHYKEMIELEEQWSKEAIALAYKIGLGVGVLITLIVVGLIKLIIMFLWTALNATNLEHVSLTLSKAQQNQKHGVEENVSGVSIGFQPLNKSKKNDIL